MKFLKQFNEVKKILAYDEEVLKTLHSQLSIYTSDGSFTFNLGNSTRETDILRASYSRKTTHKDGEPDTLSLDIHFMKNEGIRVFEAFAGFGGATFGLRKAKIKHKVVMYSEWDKWAQELFEANHKDYHVPLFADIENVDFFAADVTNNHKGIIGVSTNTL